MISTFNLRIATAIASIALAGAASAASLFNYVPAAKDAPASPMLVSPAAIAVDAQAIANAGEGGTLEVTLPDGKQAAILVEKITSHDNGDLSWWGKVIDGGQPDLAAHGTTGANGSYAVLETATRAWGIAPSSQGHDWIFDKSATDRNVAPPARLDDAILAPQDFLPRAKATCPTVSSLPTPQVTIDVLAVVAPDFVAAHGGAAKAETRLNAIFNAMNSYLAASNIAITYRRVATMNANYQAASTAGDDDSVALNALTSASGPFANVPALREFFGADMVALFRGPLGGGNSISGVAWLTGDGNGGLTASAASYMYSVHGDASWADGKLSAHELGHNLGNEHNRANAGTGGTSTAYSYGHYVCGAGAPSNCGQAGFTTAGSGFGTIMTYVEPKVGKFSSPSITCQAPGSTLSAPCGVAGQQDDVRASNCVRQQAAAIKSSWVGNCANLAADADNDGIPDCLEAASGRVNGTRDNDVFGSALLFAAQQYRDFLSREGDADGINYWMSALNGGASNRTAMIESYLTSAEFQGVVAPVARLYFAYFLRIPDYTGLQYWIGRSRSGVSLGAISQSFAASTEFVQRYGSLTNAQFVTLVYNNVLGRAPDASGLTYWTNQLAGGMSRGDVMLAFSESTENRALMANEIYVTMAYMGMLRRAPDASGFTYWTSYLDAGKAGASLIGGFLGSPEYRGRFLN